MYMYTEIYQDSELAQSRTHPLSHSLSLAHTVPWWCTERMCVNYARSDI